MRKDSIISFVVLVSIIVVLVILAVFAINKLFGNNGIISQYKEEDTEYNKSEVVEMLNLIVKEKYFGDSKYAQENNKNIDEIYTENALMDYLKTQNYIEELKDINDNIVSNEYYINTDSLDGYIVSYEVKENGSKGNGTKVFKLKKQEDKYIIVFVDKYGEEENLGELNLRPEI